jgi:hypothetical protein
MDFTMDIVPFFSLMVNFLSLSSLLCTNQHIMLMHPNTVKPSYSRIRVHHAYLYIRHFTTIPSKFSCAIFKLSKSSYLYMLKGHGEMGYSGSTTNLRHTTTNWDSTKYRRERLENKPSIICLGL